MPDLNDILTTLRSRSQQWRDTIRSASVQELMPGALADAIAAQVEAIAWFQCHRQQFETLLSDTLSPGETRAVYTLIRECLIHEFRINEDLKVKVAQYRQGVFCRAPLGVLMQLYPPDTWR